MTVYIIGNAWFIDIEGDEYFLRPIKDTPIRCFIVIVGFGLSTYILTNFLKNTNILDDEK